MNHYKLEDTCLTGEDAKQLPKEIIKQCPRFGVLANLFLMIGVGLARSDSYRTPTNYRKIKVNHNLK
jgi:hypothetical protein